MESPYPSRQVHLLAATDHTSHAVLGQTTGEIARFRPLLDRSCHCLASQAREPTLRRVAEALFHYGT